MEINELEKMWAVDGEINVADISDTGRNVPKIHNKYYSLYVKEGLKLKKYRADYKILYKLKTDYYSGKLDDDELAENGWKPCQMKILKGDIPTYLEADKDIVNLTLKIAYQEGIVEYLESIIKQINNRGFLLKTIVDFEKFKVGYG